jgi:hypothetical protein
VADTGTGRWQVVWDSGYVPGNAAPPAVPVIRIQNPALARGPIVVRGVGGWWAFPSKIHVDWEWDTRSYSGIGPWEKLTEFGWCGSSENGTNVCSYGAEVRRVASLTGDFDGYFFWGGPKGHTIVGRGGLDFTGTAFQLILVPVAYHVEVPPSVPAPQAKAVERDLLQGIESTGDSYGVPVDRPYQIGVRYQVPAVQATLVVTDEVGVQRIPVLLNTASMTSTLNYQTAGVSESRFFASAGASRTTGCRRPSTPGAWRPRLLAWLDIRPAARSRWGGRCSCGSAATRWFTTASRTGELRTFPSGPVIRATATCRIAAPFLEAGSRNGDEALD